MAYKMIKAEGNAMGKSSTLRKRGLPRSDPSRLHVCTTRRTVSLAPAASGHAWYRNHTSVPSPPELTNLTLSLGNLPGFPGNRKGNLRRKLCGRSFQPSPEWHIRRAELLDGQKERPVPRRRRRETAERVVVVVTATQLLPRRRRRRRRRMAFARSPLWSLCVLLGLLVRPGGE